MSSASRRAQFRKRMHNGSWNLTSQLTDFASARLEGKPDRAFFLSVAQANIPRHLL